MPVFASLPPQYMDTLPECPITDTASLLPHSGRMVLIDRITRYGDDFVEAGAQIKPDHILLAGGILPYTAFIELMAQAVGAYAGIQARKNAQPVRLGFLLGTRKLEIFAQSVPVGTHLLATAHMSIQDAGGMGVFDCELRWTDAPETSSETLPSDGILARASLNVYSPEHPAGTTDAV
ncbi:MULTISPECIES: ApeP family dehydratase [Neisseria]|uniref:ApeP family dehydratase n=1 Tax=Neisseria TaxID=482 RepID=UPI001864FECD|nr:thioester dehydrase [Neisseria bergeri]MBS0039187.1 thioester dehydrase [Neisseria sp. Marseille-Q1983]